MAAAAALRARRYDLLVHLTEHPRGAWLARLLGPRCGRRRRAPAVPVVARSFTHLYPLPRRRPAHVVELNLDALRRIGIQPAEDERRLVLVPGDEAEARDPAHAAAHSASRARLHPSSSGLALALQVLARDRTAALIDRLHDRGERVVLTAAPEEDELELVAAIREPARTPSPTCRASSR